jgi:hypothetical protein
MEMTPEELERMEREVKERCFPLDYPDALLALKTIRKLWAERTSWEKRMADLVEAAKAASLELAYLMEQVKARPNGSVATAKANLDKALHTSSKGGQ